MMILDISTFYFNADKSITMHPHHAILRAVPNTQPLPPQLQLPPGQLSTHQCPFVMVSPAPNCPKIKSFNARSLHKQ